MYSIYNICMCIYYIYNNYVNITIKKDFKPIHRSQYIKLSFMY